MSGVPIGFPFDLDDEHLDEAITEMLEPTNWPGFDNFAQLLPDVKLELVAAGIQERQRREQAASASRALRTAYATLATSIVALFVAVIVAVITILKA